MSTEDGLWQVTLNYYSITKQPRKIHAFVHAYNLFQYYTSMKDENAAKIVPKLMEVMAYVQELKKGDSYLIVNRNADALSKYAIEAAYEIGLDLSHFELTSNTPYKEKFPDKLLNDLINNTPKGAMGLFDYSDHKDWMAAELPSRIHLLYNVIPEIPISWVHSPGINMDMALNGALQCDHKKMAEESKYMLKLLNGVKTLKVTAPGGTDIEIKIPQEFRWDTDCRIVPPGADGEKGVFGNMPVGEIWSEKRKKVKVFDGLEKTEYEKDYPIPLLANGLLVCDVCVGMHDGALNEKQKLYIEFTDGNVSKSYCDDKFLADKIFNQWTDAETRYGLPTVLEEIGIGFNDKARPTGNMLESEKMGKTMHLAAGNIGLHVDMLFADPTVLATYNDESYKRIMDKGYV